jgi:hypothetical protein
MKKIKISKILFDEYRNMFKGEIITVYENSAWTRKQTSSMPPIAIQHIIVNDKNVVLAVKKLSEEEISYALKIHDNFHFHSVESAQKEIDFIIDAPNRKIAYEKQQKEIVEKQKQYQKKIDEQKLKQKQFELAKSPFVNTIGNIANFK